MSSDIPHWTEIPLCSNDNEWLTKKCIKEADRRIRINMSVPGWEITDNIKQVICSDPNNHKSLACQDYCSKNDCSKILIDFCSKSENMKDFPCREYCINNPGKCDQQMKTYCLTNKNDPICSCINSKVNNKIGYNPLCVDFDCISNGYQTQNLINARGDGCKIVDCNTFINFNSESIKLDNAQFSNCGLPKTEEFDKTIENIISSNSFSPVYTVLGIFFCIILIFLYKRLLFKK